MAKKSPIEHIVIIVKENHCFDNYFGTFAGANGATLAHAPNPPKTDHNHRHAAWLTRKTTAAAEQYLESDIPTYFSYARQFTLCDNYFTDVAGPSTPNHLMLVAADAPIIDNPPRNPPPLYDIPSLPINLEKKKLTWGNYGGYVFAMIKALQGKSSFRPAGAGEQRNFSFGAPDDGHQGVETSAALNSAQFAADAAAGKLPSVSWVYAPSALTEHPPTFADVNNPAAGNVTLGMQWTVDQVNAIVAGGLWPKTAVFITWDDWGGWLDHVDPPNIENWKDGTQFRYGSRVGCIVLSPYAKQGYISNVLHSHVSLVKFCEKTFGLRTLNARTKATSDMSDCFDFGQTPAPPPHA